MKCYQKSIKSYYEAKKSNDFECLSIIDNCGPNLEPFG